MIITDVAYNKKTDQLQRNEKCTCDSWEASRMVEYKISASRTEVRCGRCNGIVGWLDEPSPVKKIIPVKRAWSEEECLAMR